MIAMLPKERWPELKEIFEREFDAALPHRESARIVADIDDDTGEVKAFVVAEGMIRIGQVYQPKNNGRKLFQYLLDHMLPGAAVIVIASSKRFQPLCELFQMHAVEGKVFRRDFN
jgi:hypothetical protein